MNGKKSREAAIDFLEYLAQKGLMSPVTARARKAALNAVLGILDEHEAEDVTSINLDNVMDRFGHLQGKGYTPDSLRTYRSRVKSALADFNNYLKNPLAFKPSVQSRERKHGAGKVTVSGMKATPTSELSGPDLPRPSAAPTGGPMASSIIPIPLRADLIVFVQGLPFDLTEAEAKKIAGVIQAMAMVP